MFGHSPILTRVSRLICLAESIAVASSDEVERAVAVLLSAATEPDRRSPVFRRRHAALRAYARELLVSCWSSTPDSLRPAILRAVEPERVDAALDHVEPARLRAALDLTAQLARHARADRVVALLSHADRAVADAAHRALHVLVTSGDPLAGSRAAALSAGAFPSHRDRGVLALALRRLDLGQRRAARGIRTELGAWAADPDRPEHATVRSVIKSAPGLARRAFELLTADNFVAAALERTSRALESDEAVEIAAAWHLALRPSRARRLALARGRAPSPARPSLLASALRPEADEPVRLGAANLTPAIGMSPEERDRLLEPLLADPSARVRLALLRAGGPAARRDLCLDPSACIAGSAALEWSTTGIPDHRRTPGASGAARARLARILARSPHPRVREIARDELDRAGLERAASAASAIVARRLLDDDPARFDATIRGLLEAGGADALRALGFVRRLGLARRFEPDLTRLARDPDPQVAATAAAALARASSAHALAILRESCVHPDPRVRANAIESLSRRPEPGTRAFLLELKPDPHHRARAAALRDRLARGEPVGADALLDMLAHPSPEHRRASIWLLDRHVRARGWSVLRPRREKLLARLTEAIRSDEAEPVRAWAIRCAQGVLASTRRDWSHAAPPVHAGAAA